MLSGVGWAAHGLPLRAWAVMEVTSILIPSLISDLRFAGRQAVRNGTFTLTVLLTLGLGIGASIVIFGVFNVVVLRPLPFTKPQQLVRISEITPQGHLFSVSDPNFIDIRESNRSLSHLVALVRRPLTLISNDEPQRLSGVGTTDGMFAMLGIKPLKGAGFAAEDFEPERESGAVVISSELWRRLGQDPSVLGSTLNLDGTSHSIVGVMPEGVPAPFGADVWWPLALDKSANRAEHRLEGFGRLEEGVSLEQAREDVARLADILGEEYPQSNGGWGVSLVSLREWLIGERATRVATALLVAVILLLLLGCASVSNLLLARATARQREIAIRASLGAQRSRILSQLVVEGLALAIVAAAIGVLAAAWVLPVIQHLQTGAIPRLNEVTVDRRVLTFTLIVTVATGLICGAAPALQASRRGVRNSLRQDGRLEVEGALRIRDWLVVTQLSLAVVLLVAAGLLTNSFLRLQNVDPGFDPDDVLVAELSLPQDAYPQLSREVAIWYREVLGRIEAIPGVAAAGASMVSPLSTFRPANFVGLENEVTEQADLLSVQWRAVTPGFFAAIGARLEAGRLFDEREASATASPFAGGDTTEVHVIINRAAARALLSDANPVGRRIVWSRPNGIPMTVVGVVSDMRDVTYPADPGPTVYLPHSIVAWPTMTLLVKSSSDPAAIAGAVRREIWTADAAVPAPYLVSLQDALDEAALAGPRLNMLLLTVFAAAALGLAALGIYGVTVYSVTSRMREMSVRVALGARPKTIIGMLLSRGARLIVTGTAIGLVGSLAVTRLLTSMLYEIRPTDVLTYAAVTLTMTSVALLANYIPARRAARVDPRAAFAAE